MFQADRDNAFLTDYIITLHRNGMSMIDLTSVVQSKFKSRMDAHVFVSRLLQRYDNGLIGHSDEYMASTAP